MKFRRQLFKYLDVTGALAMLSKGTLQFTNSFYFNDPFDCHPSLISLMIREGLTEKHLKIGFEPKKEIFTIDCVKIPGYVVCPR